MRIDRLAGQEINDRYLLEEKLAGGSMGVVYRGVDLHLSESIKESTPVVVKFLIKDDEESEDRFRLEAKTLLDLNHSNICRIYSIKKWQPPDEEDEYLFIVMKYYEGRTLDRIIREGKGRLDYDRIRNIAKQVAQGLSYAHSKKVYHRDLKPANIMVGPGDSVTILDFGIVRNVEAGTVTRHPGFVLGTPFYMSPEQAMGRQFDHRSDIWSLGVIVYEMCTGKRPFETIDATIEEEPKALPAKLDADLKNMILRAMSKDPEDRFANCEDLIREISHIHEISRAPSKEEGLQAVDGNRSTSRLRSSIENVSTASDYEIPTRKVSIWLWPVLMVAALSVVTYMLVVNLTTEEPPTVSEIKMERAQQSISRGRRDEGILAWLVALKESDRDDWRKEAAGAIGDDYPSLAATFRHAAGDACIVAADSKGEIVATGSSDGRLRLWRWRDAQQLGAPIDHGGELWVAAFSPDGSRIATGGADKSGVRGIVRQWELDRQANGSHNPLPPLDEIWHENTVENLSYDHSGRFLITADRFSVRLWNVDSGRRIGDTTQHQAAILDVWDMATVNEFMTINNRGEMLRLDHAGTESSHGNLIETQLLTAASASYDGAAIVGYEDLSTAVGIWSLREEQEKAGSFFEDDLRVLAVSSDLIKVLSGTAEGIARVWNSRGEMLGDPLVHSHSLCAATFTHDGDRVLTGSLDGVARLWDLSRLRQSEPQRLFHLPSPVRSVDLHETRDIFLVGSAKGDLIVWDFGEERIIWERDHLHKGSVSGGVAFMPGNESVVSAGEDATIYRIDVETDTVKIGRQHSRGVRALDTALVGDLFATGSDDGTVRIWNLSSATSILPPMRHSDPVRSLVLSPDAKRIAVGTDLGEIVLWTIEDGQEILRKRVFPGVALTALAIGRIGREEVFIIGNEEGEVVFWNGETQDLANSRLSHERPVDDLVYLESKDILLVVTGQWVHSYSTEDLGLLGSVMLPGEWTGAYRTSDSCDVCLEMVLKANSSAVFVETVFFNRSDKVSLIGDVNSLYEEWSRRLSLTYDEEADEYQPLH